MTANARSVVQFLIGLESESAAASEPLLEACVP
jgi:hypothetical protein